MSSRRSRERRHLQLDDIEAVVEILAEAAVADRLPQVGVGRGDDAHPRPPGDLEPSRSNSPVCSTRSSFACAAAGEVAELVEEQRAAIGRLETPGARARAGEGAGLGAEELGLDQLLGQRAAD